MRSWKSVWMWWRPPTKTTIYMRLRAKTNYVKRCHIATLRRAGVISGLMVSLFSPICASTQSKRSTKVNKFRRKKNSERTTEKCVDPKWELVNKMTNIDARGNGDWASNEWRLFALQQQLKIHRAHCPWPMAHGYNIWKLYKCCGRNAAPKWKRIYTEAPL